MLITDSKVHVAYTGPTWGLAAPDGPHVYLMNLVIRDNVCMTELYSSGRYVHTAGPPFTNMV